MLTTSPPGSVHLVGAAVKRATRRALGRRPARLARRAPAPARRRASPCVQGAGHARRRAARRPPADAIVAVSDAIADETRELEPRGRSSRSRTAPTSTTSPASTYRPADRFRITHAGSFFGKRDPRPFLTALAESGLDVRRALRRRLPRRRPRVGRDARARRPARAASRTCRAAASLELQRDSEALLLLIPEAGGRGQGRPLRQGLRVPRRRAADPRRRAARRRRRGADPRDRRGHRRRRPTTSRRSRDGARRPRRALARGRARRDAVSPEQRATGSRARARVEELADLLAEPRRETRRRDRRVLFLATLFCVTFEKVHWNVAGDGQPRRRARARSSSSRSRSTGSRARRPRAPRRRRSCSAFFAAFLLVYLLGFFNLDTRAGARPVRRRGWSSS